MKQIIRKTILLAISLVMSVAAFAQVTSSSMSGVVKDETGAPVAGVNVLAVHTPSGTQYYTVTNENGIYSLLNILPGGPYSVTAQMLGFSDWKTEGVNVDLADNAVINIVISEQSLSLNEVVVVAESKTSNMRSDRAGASTTVNLAAVESLPTISRSLEDVVKFTPQSFNGGDGPQLGGGTYRQNNFTIDGAAANNAFGIGQSMPAGGSPISMDAIEQMSINLTPFDVRQSGFIGAAMNAVTRSGHNKFEASAYSYFYNEKFRGTRVSDETLSLNPEQHLVVGARIGGPIIKNKLFFFANVEIQRDKAPGPSRRASSPEHPFDAGVYARPSEETMNMLGDYLRNEWGYDPGAYQGYSSEKPGLKVLARIDWNINTDHKLNVSFNLTNSKYPSSPSTSQTVGNVDKSVFSGGNRTSMYSLYFQNNRYYQEQNYKSVAAELNSRFLEGRVTNMLRATWSHQYEPRSYEGGTFPAVDIVLADDGIKKNATYASFGTELFTYGNLRDVNTVLVTDDVQSVLGRHTLTAGIQYEWNRTKNGFQRAGTGWYTLIFQDEQDLQNAIRNDTLFNNPYQYGITHSLNDPTYSQAFPQFDFHQFSAYIQDEVKWDRFKLTFGLRIEVPIYPSLANNFNKQVAEATFRDYKGNGGKYDTRQLPSTSVMFSPRVGINWDILGDRSLVLRGGTGLFTGRLPFVWIVAQAGDSGVIQNTYWASSNPSKEGYGNLIPEMHKDKGGYSDHHIDALHQIYGDGGATAEQAKISSISLMAPDLKMPQSWKSSLAIDYIIPGNILFSVEGIYNYDVNPVTIKNVGLKDPVMSNINDFADNRYVWGPKYDSGIPTAYLLCNDSKGGYYYSITAKLEKRNFHGFDGMIAYTYANGQSYNDGFGDQVYSAWSSAYTVMGQDYSPLGYAGYVMPHHLIASLSYHADYAKYFGTGISIFYDGGPRGRYSYTYTSNIVGDGGANNLIYVPKTKDELTFHPYTYTDADGNKQTYTAEAQAEDFWNFVNNSDYLKTRKGQYAERNGAVAPWTHQFDVKIWQNFHIPMKNGQRHTIQLGLNIKNIGNLFNKNWGNVWGSTATAILKTDALAQGSTTQQAKPTYEFQRYGTEALVNAYRPIISTSSTWQMQISLRYIFQ